MKKPLTKQERIYRLNNMEFDGEGGFEKLCRMFNVQDDGIYANDECPNCNGIYIGSRKITRPKGNGGPIGKRQAKHYADYVHHEVCSGGYPYATDYVEGWYDECLLMSTDTTYVTFKQFLEALMQRDFRIRFKVDSETGAITQHILLPPYVYFS